MKLTRHPSTSMVAYEGSVGIHRVEVIKAYNNDWFVCHYIGGAMQRGAPEHLTYQQALARATAIIESLPAAILAAGPL
jgi:hypothetical protein